MTHDLEKRPELQDLVRSLEGSDEGLARFVLGAHAADLGQWLEELDEQDRFRVYRSLPLDERAELLGYCEDDVRESLVRRLSVDELVELVEVLPADEVVDLLALLDDATSERVLRAVDFRRAQGLRELAQYDEETAGGLMTTDFVSISEDAHVGDAIKEIRSEEGPASEEEVGIFVVDDAQRPVGFVSDRELLTTAIHTPIRDVMDTDVISVSVDTDQEDVANLVSKYDLNAVPVVDADGTLIGVIAADDAQDVLEEELEEDIRRLVGTSPLEQTRLPILQRVRGRIPLQAVTVIGGVTMAFLLRVGLGETSSGILRYLPLVLGLAGNVGSQCSTILVRAYATGEMTEERWASHLRSELWVGLIIGIICGVLTAVIAGVTEGVQSERGLHLALAVGAAITVAVTWSAYLGCTVPMLCQRFGIDPAIAAGPFMMSLSDVSGSAIFIFVAHQLVQLGGGGAG